MVIPQESILIVDDDAGVLTALDAELQDYFDVTAVSSADLALASLQSRDYAAIISDVRMPGIDGLSLIKQCAARYPNMVRIILTAFDGDDVHETALGPGQAYKLVKPWGDDLLITLRNALKQRQSAVSLRRHLDLKSELLDIDRRLHPKLTSEQLFNQAALEMSALPEVIASAVYTFDEHGAPMKPIRVAGDNIPKLIKGRSSSVSVDDQHLYTVPIGSWPSPAAAVALRLEQVDMDSIRYFDFVARQAYRTYTLIRSEHPSVAPSPFRNEKTVSCEWITSKLTTPAIVLGSATSTMVDLEIAFAQTLKDNEEMANSLMQFAELSVDMVAANKALVTVLDQIKAHQKNRDENQVLE